MGWAPNPCSCPSKSQRRRHTQRRGHKDKAETGVMALKSRTAGHTRSWGRQEGPPPWGPHKERGPETPWAKASTVQHRAQTALRGAHDTGSMAEGCGVQERGTPTRCWVPGDKDRATSCHHHTSARSGQPHRTPRSETLRPSPPSLETESRPPPLSPLVLSVAPREQGSGSSRRGLPGVWLCLSPALHPIL